MTQKLKVMTIVGTRPEIIRLSRVIPACDSFFDHVLIHTGQSYDSNLSDIFFKELNIRNPDFHFGAGKNSSPCQLIGTVLVEVEKSIQKFRPDAVLILGDTNSSLAAYPAKRLNVPVFHMEAGNRCFDHRVPEEINRKIVDHIADYNLPYSQIARSYLIREGIHPSNIFVTGSPMKEVIDFYKPQISASQISKKLDINPLDYIVVSFHREENLAETNRVRNILDTIRMLQKQFNKKIIISTHPRTRSLVTSEAQQWDQNFTWADPFGYFDYMSLQINSFLTVSDSGTITEESSILNFPALNLRESQERPEGMEEASVVLTGIEPNHVLQCAELVVQQPRNENRFFQVPTDYQSINVSQKVVRIIQSHAKLKPRIS